MQGYDGVDIDGGIQIQAGGSVKASKRDFTVGWTFARLASINRIVLVITKICALNTRRL